MFNETLGECFNLAEARHDNLMLLKYAQKTGRDKCCICDWPILNAEDLTLEHTERWEKYSEEKCDAVLFMDKSKIKFAHDFCNGPKRKNKLGEKIVGVHQPQEGPYIASIELDGRCFVLGRYHSIFEGQLAYDLAAFKNRKGAGIYNFKNNFSEYDKILGPHFGIDNEIFMSVRKGSIKKLAIQLAFDLTKKEI